jgi:hypothetical protein
VRKIIQVECVYSMDKIVWWAVFFIIAKNGKGSIGNAIKININESEGN